MATKFIFKCSITSQLVLFWLHSNFCFLIFHLLGKNKVAYWKSASLVAWKCLKSSCWGGGGWLPSHYQVKLQLMLRLSRAVNILNIVKIWGRFHCPCPWDACYKSVLATWDEIITGPWDWLPETIGCSTLQMRRRIPRLTRHAGQNGQFHRGHPNWEYLRNWLHLVTVPSFNNILNILSIAGELKT